MNTNNTDWMTKAHVETLIACMLSIANVDGVRPEELALIKAFHAQCQDLGVSAFASLEGTANQAESMLQAVPTSVEYGEQVVLMSLMTGYSDGNLSDAEKAQVVILAKAAGVQASRVDELQETVKDSLIGSLSHLPDSESVAAVVKNL